MPATTPHAAAPALRTCPSCRQGHLQPATRERVFHPHGQEVRVELQTSICDHCTAEVTSAAQHQENLQRLTARKEHYGGLLLGEEIGVLRRRYGLTQQQASRIFGKGKIAFSRYESETTYPDESTTRLLAMAIAKPDALKWLADQAGEDIPLWRERCEDSRLSIRPVPGRLAHVTAVKQRLEFHAPEGTQPAPQAGWRQLGASARDGHRETTREFLRIDRMAA